MDPARPPDGVGATAFGVAALRAVESHRADRLIADPYAQLFLDAVAAGNPDALTRWAASESAGSFLELMADQVALRTHVLDRRLLAATAHGHTPAQVVLLACGLDTRAWRLEWPPGTRLFELDLPEVLAFKNAVLEATPTAPHCERVCVPADLTGDWTGSLFRGGMWSDQPTVWLVEGLLYALSPSAADQLITTISAISAPGSRLLGDHIHDSPVLHRARAAVDPALNQPWAGGPAGPPDVWLRDHGWDAEAITLSDLAPTLGRAVPPAFDPELADTAPAWVFDARSHPSAQKQ